MAGGREKRSARGSAAEEVGLPRGRDVCATGRKGPGATLWDRGHGQGHGQLHAGSHTRSCLCLGSLPWKTTEKRIDRGPD